MPDLETIYRQHSPAVFRYAWGLCGNRSEAEDLVSETFVRLLTRAPRLETRTALGARAAQASAGGPTWDQAAVRTRTLYQDLLGKA